MDFRCVAANHLPDLYAKSPPAGLCVGCEQNLFYSEVPSFAI